MSILKWQVNSSSNFASFFIVMTRNSFLDFKLILFLLWIKGSHQNPNFETFKCSGENLPYSCHFPNHKPVFLQILHHLSESWKLTPLYFLGQTLNTLHNWSKWKCTFWGLASAQVKFHEIPVTFEAKDQFFFQILHQSSVLLS